MEILSRIRNLASRSELELQTERYQRIQAETSAHRYQRRCRELEFRLIRCLEARERLEDERR